MRIRMLSSQMGTANPSGSATMRYVQGEIYEMRADWQSELARVFVAQGWAEDIGALKTEAKDRGAAPENKAIPGAEETAGEGPIIQETGRGWYSVTDPKTGEVEKLRRPEMAQRGLIAA